jgi:hemoglobin-like flavoprotein
MTPREIQLVQDSFHSVAPLAEWVAATFYARLFELDPRLRSLFRADLTEQRRKLMDMLRAIVANLRSIDRLVPGIQAMAKRHSGHGVKVSDYATVGQALIETLQKLLGAEFTHEVRMAWFSAYLLLAETMIDASEEELRSA